MNRRNTPDVFWSRVDKSAGPEACWPWTGRKVQMPNSWYGVYDHDGTNDYAHRYAWLMTYGSFPEPNANHHCDNGLCCNVQHMYEGTQQENVADRDRRGRRNVKGERHPGVKLTDAQVAAIRASFTGARGEQTALAAQYHVTVSTIHLIVRGKSR